MSKEPDSTDRLTFCFENWNGNVRVLCNIRRTWLAARGGPTRDRAGNGMKLRVCSLYLP